MNDIQLQAIAYLYGRSREKLKQSSDDIATYDDYHALNQRLWRILKANDAVHHGSQLKRKFIAFVEAGRKSVEAKLPKTQWHESRIFEVKHRSQLHGTS